LLADAADLLGVQPPVAQRRARTQAVGGRRDRAEAEDRARSADHAIEAGLRDLVEVGADLGVDVAHELALVARLERIAVDEPLGEADDAELEAPAGFDVRAGAPRHLD